MSPTAGDHLEVQSLPATTPRLGLCCAFVAQPQFKFRTTTVAYLSSLQLKDPTSALAREYYGGIIRNNLGTLEDVVHWCSAHDVRAFRVNSDLFPRATHPLVIPWVDELLAMSEVQEQCARVKRAASELDIRLSEHPDQFLVGNSLRADVVNGTIAELEWRGKLGDLLGYDVICLHGGSGLPDRESALWRWEATLERLSPRVLSKLALENDDRVFTPQDILSASLAWGLPLIYDAHHHRVHADDLSEAEATELAIASWGDREPYFHLSSPRDGWDARDARPHHDLIELTDWPDEWTQMWRAGVKFTVDVEAKSKEQAVLSLLQRFTSS